MSPHATTDRFDGRALRHRRPWRSAPCLAHGILLVLLVSPPALSGADVCETQMIIPPDGALGDNFGVAMSAHEDLLVIGAPSDDDAGSASGAVHVLRAGPSGWGHETKLLPDDGAAGDLFGRAVAVRGSVAIVGAPFDDAPEWDSGSAYVFRHDGEA
jgi:hypothetical protein